MRARRMKYKVIGRAVRKSRHYDTEEGLFSGTWHGRGVGGISVLVSICLPRNVDSFTQLATGMGRLRLKQCGSITASTIFVVYPPTSVYDEDEVEAFYMDLETFHREDHTFFEAIIGPFLRLRRSRRMCEECHIDTHG
ncbi:unnamed protein product [Angiostrongylus costaricensis]|uniref:Helicase C-terminal domain-containing protein n=1 Tax=Angiostrongylus costaricensis TaxID=334426 RepID=A0A0R3PE75_ANGCS|nr:unnamed protein product [Angiostrongylus costaricensis]